MALGGHASYAHPGLTKFACWKGGPNGVGDRSGGGKFQPGWRVPLINVRAANWWGYMGGWGDWVHARLSRWGPVGPNPGNSPAA